MELIMKSTIAGLLLVFVGIVGPIAYGVSWEFFINFPSIAIIVLIAGGLTLMRYQKGVPRAELLASVKIYCLLSGVIGGMIGLLQVAFSFHGRETINIPGLFAGLGVCLLIVFYSLILYCIIDATQHRKVGQ
jgi:hypothetical protein